MFSDILVADCRAGFNCGVKLSKQHGIFINVDLYDCQSKTNP